MADNFDIAGRKQNVERDSFKNLAAMRDYDPNYLPDIFIATCEETNTLYLYNVKNEVDATTGKWRAISIDGYTKDEVDEMFSQLTGLKGEIVDSLPTENISLNTIYMVPHATKENSYIQFMYINGTWANIGSTDIDLTNYATKEDLDKKVDKEDGLGLSQNNLTDELVFEIEKIKDKVDKEDNKGLSTNDLTDDLLAEINKVKDKQDALIPGDNIVIDPETNTISASGDIAVDYEKTTNKPTINDVELVGNVTTEDLGLVDKETLEDYAKVEVLDNYVLIAQGEEYKGKALIVDDEGNVAPSDIEIESPSWTGTKAEFEALDKSTLKDGQQVNITDDSDKSLIDDSKTTTENVWSAKKVNASLVDKYSTDEIKTNKVWIDGKPIYRKVIEFNMGTTTQGRSSTKVIDNIPNISAIVGMNGYVRWSVGVANGTAGIPYIHMEGTNIDQMFTVYCNGTGDITLAYYLTTPAYDNENGQVIIEYIKNS